MGYVCLNVPAHPQFGIYGLFIASIQASIAIIQSASTHRPKHIRTGWSLHRWTNIRSICQWSHRSKLSSRQRQEYRYRQSWGCQSCKRSCWAQQTWSKPSLWVAVVKNSGLQMYINFVEWLSTHQNQDQWIPESAMGLSSSRHLSYQCARIDLMVSSCYNSPSCSEHCKETCQIRVNLRAGA